MKYKITAYGCHDLTVAVLDLTEAEHAAIMRVSLAINTEITDGCMPRLYVEAAEGADRD